jgi:hypothetical protein
MEHGGGGASAVAARRLWLPGRRTSQACNMACLPSLSFPLKQWCQSCSPQVPSAAGTALLLTPPASAWSLQVCLEEARPVAWRWWVSCGGWVDAGSTSHPSACHKGLRTPHTVAPSPPPASLPPACRLSGAKVHPDRARAGRSLHWQRYRAVPQVAACVATAPVHPGRGVCDRCACD